MRKNQPSFRVLLFVCSTIFSLSTIAQGTLLLRQPSVSKQHIVFVHGDDLWVVAREGGDARRLTSAVGAENNPRISADGKMGGVYRPIRW
jgi:tricorn protease